MAIIPIARVADLADRLPHIILTADMAVEDLPPCSFYASSTVGDALGLPGSSSRFGQMRRSTSSGTGTVALLQVWAADWTPASYFERRRLASTGWASEYTRIR
ncbi:hypothetical protein U6G28_08745 [Actinomycetaceae bacterium MB13-C1-2]|nr:hypothetical protein U6G28_08745 [Actinomycetaceae bacterium MB13-C1-2]